MKAETRSAPPAPTSDVFESRRPPYSDLSNVRRRVTIAIVAVAAFLGPLAAGVYLPALPTLAAQFGTTEATVNATASVFMVTLAVAPLFWASHADYAGRKPLYLVSLLIYIAANVLLAAVPPNLAALFVLRIMQAFGGSSVISLAAGTVADAIPPKARGAAMSWILLGPQCGPIIGPILGGTIVGNVGWRWIFAFLAIFATLTFVIVVFFLPETLRSIVGTGAIYADSPLILRPSWRHHRVVDSTKYPKAPQPSLLSIVKLLRMTSILVISLNGAILFSAYQAMTVVLPYHLEREYHFSSTKVGLACIGPGAALVAGSLTSGRVSDLYRSRFRTADGSAPSSKVRLRLQVLGIVISASGTLAYGWLLWFHIHVAALLIALAVAAFGMTWVFVTTTVYLTETSAQTPATLVAMASLFRNLAAAVSTAIAGPLISHMGAGWCFTGFALAEVLCVPAVLWLVFSKKERSEESQH